MDKKLQVSLLGNQVNTIKIANETKKEVIGEKISKEAAASVDAILKKVAKDHPNLVLTKVAKMLTEPLRLFLDVATISRQFFMVDNKNEGEMAYYDLDLFPLTNAVTFGLNGNPTLNWIRARRFIPKYFIISAIAKIPLDAMKWFRYDIVTRAKDRLKQAIAIKEDLLTFTQFTAAAQVSGNYFSTTTTMQPAHIGKIMARIEAIPLVPWALVIHPYALASMRSWTNANIDEVARVEIRSTGYLGNLYSLNIFISRLVPAWDSKYVAYVTPSKEFIGVMPIWSDIEIYASNNLDMGAVGFLAWEMLGMQVHNPRAIVAAEFNAEISLT